MARVMVAPMPTAAPLMAPITGLRQLKIASVTRPPVSRTPAWMAASFRRVSMSSRVGIRVSSSPKTLPGGVKSIPAQKARPSPVTMMARTASSSLTAVKKCSSSSAISTVKALSWAGRCRVRVSTPSSSAVFRVVYVMGPLQKVKAPA